MKTQRNLACSVASLVLPVLLIGCGEATEALETEQDVMARQEQALSVYSNNFQSGFGHEWTRASGAPFTIDTSSPTGQIFLGRFSNDTMNLKLTNLPAGHTRLKLISRVYFIHSWDGDGAVLGYGPDRFQIKMDGTLMVNNTFRDAAGDTQGYPFPGSAPRTGAENSNFLFLKGSCTGSFDNVDSTYYFELEIPHTGSTANISYSASGLQPLCDESWGIDDVIVQAY